MLVIGFTGTFGSGKQTAIDLILARFPKAFLFSTSDETRREAKARGRAIDRPSLVQTVNELRADRGPGVLAERAVAAIQAAKPRLALVDGLRHPAEVQALRSAFGADFVLVAVDAPIRVRYARIRARGRDGEAQLSFERFQESERGELDGRPGFSQNIRACMALADEKIENAGTREALAARVGDLLRRLGFAGA